VTPELRAAIDRVRAFVTAFHQQAKWTGEPDELGGLIASGWHTAALTMRLLVENYLSEESSLGSPGIDELRWIKPVRPGDALSVRVMVDDARRSRSRPDRGLVRSSIEVRNQSGETVMTFKAMSLIGLRNPGAGAAD